MTEIFNFFYTLAEYANVNWNKGKATPRVLAQTAFLWFQNLEYGVEAYSTTLENLTEDVENGNTEAQQFIDEIYDLCERF